MDPALQIEVTAQSHQKKVDIAIKQGDSPVQLFYNEATIFLTGVTGFIGKQLLEKLIRSCNLKKAYVLVRPKKGQNIKERLKKVLEDPIFDTLRMSSPKSLELIYPIEGDLMEMELGISVMDRKLLINEVNVVFHGAATVNFDEPIKSATFTNVRGTREMLRLAESSPNLRSFVYISTAYSNATIGRCDTDILEKFYSPPPMSPELLINLAEAVDEDRLEGAKLGINLGWPNTYAFTKVLAEDIIRTNKLSVPVAIVRPTIVICSRREPYPGWVDKNGILGPTGIILGASMGVLHALRTRYEIKIDFVPVDFVSNVAIASVVHGASNGDVMIYHVGTSDRNHLTWGGLATFLKNVVRQTVISPKAVWYCFVMESHRPWLVNVYNFGLHTVPACLVDALCWVVGKPRRFRKLYAKVNKLGNVLTFYTTNNWTFVDKNTSDLYRSLTENDKSIYQCNAPDIDWKELILLWCVGARRYIVQDGLKGTVYSQKIQKVYRLVTYILSVFLVYIAYLFIYTVFVFLFGY